MLATRERAVEYLYEIPEDKLPGVIDYLRFMCAPQNPVEVTTKEEFIRRIEEGLDDIQQGRVLPLDEAMQEIKQALAQYGV